MKDKYSEDMKHEAWVRMDCIAMSHKIHRFSGVDKVIEGAKKIERYVTGSQPCEVVRLVKRDSIKDGHR